MIHESKIYALAGGFIERRSQRDVKTGNDATALITLSGLRNMREMCGNGQVCLQFSGERNHLAHPV
jgi:hypothetical protein